MVSLTNRVAITGDALCSFAILDLPCLSIRVNFDGKVDLLITFSAFCYIISIQFLLDNDSKGEFLTCSIAPHLWTVVLLEDIERGQ